MSTEPTPSKTQRNLHVQYGNVPRAVLQSAELLSHWAKQNGHEEWQLLGIASRKSVLRLERELAAMTKERDDQHEELERLRAANARFTEL